MHEKNDSTPLYFYVVQKCIFSVSDLNIIKWNELLKEFEVDFETSYKRQNVLMTLTVRHPIIVKYPIKVTYRQRFLKELISKLEEKNIEVSDVIYSNYVELLHLNCGSQHEASHYRHFVLPNDACVSVLEKSSYISNGTTGLCTWQGSFALSEWIIKNSNEFDGKKILELGSGTGLAGLTLMKCCQAKCFYFSDCHDDVLKQLRCNVEFNIGNKSERFMESTNHQISNANLTKPDVYFSSTSSDCDVKILNLHWENIINYDLLNLEFPDIIIGSDIVYDSSLFSPLSNTLEYFLKGRDTYLLLVCTIRNDDTYNTFVNFLSTKCFKILELTNIVTSDVIPYSIETPMKFLKITYGHLPS